VFEEKNLAEKTVYRQVAELLPAYFATRPLIPLAGSNPVTLLDLLRRLLCLAAFAPGAIALIRLLWKPCWRKPGPLAALGGEILHEEELLSGCSSSSGEGRRGKQQWPAQAPFRGANVRDPATNMRVQSDMAWMPPVLIAKSTYVWLRN